jgi:hypothetical protein
MSIEIKTGIYYLGMWYCEVSEELHPPSGGNLMACLWRQYRHRYYDVEEMERFKTLGIVQFPSDDVSNWYEGNISGLTEEEVEFKMFEFFGLMKETVGAEAADPQVFLIKGDSDKFFELIRTNPPYWMHAQTIPNEE